jgi:hypothetical protein
MRLLAVLLLAFAPLAGCVAVAAGAAAGYAITQEVLPNDVHTATIALDVDVVWPAAKDALRGLSTRPLDVTETPRVVKGVVDGADVTLEVHAFDLDRTIVEVRAERFLASRGATAQRVLDRVIERLPER